MEGWAQEEGPRLDSMQPITSSILKGLKEQWSQVSVTLTSSNEMVLFHVAALLAFFATLRVCELVAGSKTDTSNRALRLSDVQPAGGKLTISDKEVKD